MTPALDFNSIMYHRWVSYHRAHKTITIVAIANRDAPSHERAILQTASCVPFECKKLMISTSPPQNKEIAWVKDNDWGEGRKKFAGALGEWTLKKLVNYIDTDAVIIVQTDGYAINKAAWTDEFFDYDYIGAPFPLWLTIFMRGSMFRRVGGAGFSYRSKKFLETTSKMNYSPDLFWLEDISTSRIYHKEIEKLGCSFAPVDLALKWCIEYRLEDYPNWKLSDSFGWHGINKKGIQFFRLSHFESFYGAAIRKLRGLKP